MATYRTCDGMRRRDFLRVGVLGGAGLNLAGYLRMADAGEVRDAPSQAGVFIHLGGGPSHLDMFDMKPDAAPEFRGQFQPIATNVEGIHICEHMPKLAQCADKYAIIRGVSHTLGEHRLGVEYVNTGNRPLASLEYPGYGAVYTKETESPHDLPPFVAIPNSPQRAGFLGVQYAPLSTGATPRAGQPFAVRGISLQGGLKVSDVERRRRLLQDLDRAFADVAEDHQLLEGLDRFSQQAHSIITSDRAREAFDVSKESPDFAKQFDAEAFSQSCLLAVRLVESGVRFISLSLGGWDTHVDNFNALKTRLLPRFDQGLAALLAGLEQKGLLDSTAVMVTGEFGRTPKINTRSAEGGRDHYPRCMFMLMAGGAVRGGQVIGQSDKNAAAPLHEAYSPDDVAASFYYNLGIDFKKEYHTASGRPVMIVRDGSVIRPLFA